MTVKDVHASLSYSGPFDSAHHEKRALKEPFSGSEVMRNLPPLPPTSYIILKGMMMNT